MSTYHVFVDIFVVDLFDTSGQGVAIIFECKTIVYVSLDSFQKPFSISSLWNSKIVKSPVVSI